MDPVTTTALAAVLVKVLDGASGEAGRQLWSGFCTLARRTATRRTRPDPDADADSGEDEQTETPPATPLDQGPAGPPLSPAPAMERAELERAPSEQAATTPDEQDAPAER